MSAKMAFTIGSRWCSGNSTASTSHRSGAGTALMNSPHPAAGSSTRWGRPINSYTYGAISFHTAVRASR